MEIKVQCDCGQKFKFDVEPLHGRMPFTVNCPVCGLDGTARANVIMQQLLPPQPITSSAPPPPSHIPAPSSAPAPAPMRPAGLSISRPPAAQPAAVEASETPEELQAEETSNGAGGVHLVKLGWKGWGAIALVIILGIGSSYLKSAQRSMVRDGLDWVFDKITGKSSATSDDPVSVAIGGADSTAAKTVLPDDNGIMVLVKNPDAAVVAQACQDFYSERNQTKLYRQISTNAAAEGLFNLHPANQSYVEIDGPVIWEAKDVLNVTALSEFLSRKLATTCVCALMGDDAESGTVAIYENGERRFRCDHEIRLSKGELVDDVQLDGQAWAAGLGFKPGAKGWNGFTMDDADQLTQRLGFTPAAAPSRWIVLSTKPQPQ